MTTRVLLTVDTELAWRHSEAGCSWEENYARSVEPAGVGLTYQLDRLARHGLKACFFVDPMPACRYGIEPIRRMVETVLAARQEVQLHLHPAWAGGGGRVFELTGLGRERQRALLADAAQRLVEAGAPRPIAFRAGSYGADDATLRALAELGFRYDSSFNASHAPWPSAISPQALSEAGPVRELEVSHIKGRGGSLRHLQLCAVSFPELRDALTEAAAAPGAAVTLVSHSFELATRDGLRANRIVKRRFDRLCAWLGEQRPALETVHFADLPDPFPRADLPHLRSRGWQKLARNAEQAVGNLVYERRL